ncbi:MAG TPA: PSD1 and planctomycete cytochrome C domain-containing protein [Blastocatellia bacterium]|nr:PSD1 and planctomycete cytochrome C domain-containing protein [Blastocatellia bacterium]
MSATNYRLKLLISVCFIGLALLSASSVFNRASAAQTTDPTEFFEKRIRPTLVANCAKCHNPKAQVAQLDLTTAEGFAKGGESGSLINKEKPEESRLLKAISYDDSLKMPPTGKIKADEIAALTDWVKMGAPWPKSSGAVAESKPAVPKSTREFTEEEKKFWAFQPLAKPTVPAVKNAAWVKSPIDAFILAKLEEKNLTPAPPADKLTLLRRATYDLTGLPPSEKEISDFLADASPKAFEKVVERLLASPRYGEKWGRHWLDVARYADSTGNDEDHRYPFAWKYRDYVIESFNRDLPYDQFIREQLAGDQLPAKNGSEINQRGIIATGFLALGPKAVAQQDKKKMLYDVYDEQVDVTSKAFLGMTLACARCHNHKFDALLTKDYYSMINIFASTKSFTNPDSHVSIVFEKPLVPKSEWEKYQAARKQHQAKEKRARTEIDEIVDAVREPAVKQQAPRIAEYMLAASKVYSGSSKSEELAQQLNLSEEILNRWVKFLKPADLTPQHLLAWQKATPEKLADVAQEYQRTFMARLQEWTEIISKWRVEYQKAIAENKTPLPDKPVFEAGDDRFFDSVYFENEGPLSLSVKEKAKFSAAQQQRIAELQKEIETLKKSAPAEPELACAIEDGEPVAQKVFVRGDYNNAGEDAPKAFPAILAPFDTKPNFSGSGRLQLAEWLVQPEHPLTSRVMTNRIWQWHFGEGLVRTPDNFGKMGERPSHPELLDFLAREFVKNGWSIKSMHRLIMLSSAYQMASLNPNLAENTDTDNRLLTRFNRRRLTVEELRDGLLAIDGSIDLTMGGSLQQGRGTDGENNQGRLSLNPEKVKRRTVYIPLRRANLPTLLNLFDFGDATSMAGKRQLTNVSTQALFWLNSEFLAEQSGTLVKALLADGSLTEAKRIESLYMRVLNRNAEKDEIEQALKYISAFKQKASGENADHKAWQSFCHVLMASNDFLYID